MPVRIMVYNNSIFFEKFESVCPTDVPIFTSAGGKYWVIFVPEQSGPSAFRVSPRGLPTSLVLLPTSTTPGDSA